jgi:hypothetical protein
MKKKKGKENQGRKCMIGKDKLGKKCEEKTSKEMQDMLQARK